MEKISYHLGNILIMYEKNPYHPLVNQWDMKKILYHFGSGLVDHRKEFILS